MIMENVGTQYHYSPSLCGLDINCLSQIHYGASRHKMYSITGFTPIIKATNSLANTKCRSSNELFPITKASWEGRRRKARKGILSISKKIGRKVLRKLILLRELLWDVLIWNVSRKLNHYFEMYFFPNLKYGKTLNPNLKIFLFSNHPIFLANLVWGPCACGPTDQ